MKSYEQVGWADPADQDIHQRPHVSISQFRIKDSSKTLTHLTCLYSCNFLVVVCLSFSSFMVGNGSFNTCLYII